MKNLPARSVEDLRRLVQADEHLSKLLAEVERRMSEASAASGSDAAHDVAHFFRVAHWMLKLSQNENPLDPRLAIAACLLHDIVNVPKNSPERSKASEYSAAVAHEILPAYGFTPVEVTLIGDAIRDHSFSRGAVPATFFGKCLQDADRLESLGILGVMRTISTGVKMGAQYFHPQDPFAHHRDLDDLQFSVDHFFNKILKLPSLMNTEAGRIEGELRAKTIYYCLEKLREELGL